MFTREHDVVSHRRIRAFPADSHIGDGGEVDLSWDTVYVSAGFSYTLSTECVIGPL
jgi:hypothetical protein